MNRYPNSTICPDCAESLDTDCPDCGGYGTVTNPTIDMRYLRDCIAAYNVPADLYMSGGNCATIGIGGFVPATDDPYTFGGDFAYLVGVGYYPDGTAHRDELGAGSDEYFHVATPNAPDGSPQFPRDPYAIVIRDDETVEMFAGRIAAQYAALTRDHHRDPITAYAGSTGAVCLLIPAADVDRIASALDVIRQDDDTADDTERAAIVRAADDAHRAITRATT